MERFFQSAFPMKRGESPVLSFEGELLKGNECERTTKGILQVLHFKKPMASIVLLMGRLFPGFCWLGQDFLFGCFLCCFRFGRFPFGKFWFSFNNLNSALRTLRFAGSAEYALVNSNRDRFAILDFVNTDRARVDAGFTASTFRANYNSYHCHHRPIST